MVKQIYDTIPLFYLYFNLWTNHIFPLYEAGEGDQKIFSGKQSNNISCDVGFFGIKY